MIRSLSPDLTFTQLFSLSLFVFLFSLTAVMAQTTDDGFTPSSPVPNSPEAATLMKFVDIPVSNYTGTPSINIPLSGLSEKDMGVSLSLSYHASGHRVDEVANWVGLGWKLDAGGMITRKVRGLPDDADIGTGFLELRNQTTYNDVFHAMANQDLILLEGAATSCKDVQSDEFYFSFAGYDGKFAFDWTGSKPVISSSSDVIIDSYTTNPGSNKIVEWKLITPDGKKYTFGEIEETENLQTYSASSPCTSGNQKYTSGWYLTKIESLNFYGRYIEFEYDPYTLVRDWTFFQSRSYSDSGNDWRCTSFFSGATISNSSRVTIFGKRIKAINTASDYYSIDFIATTDRTDLGGIDPLSTNLKRLDEIRINGNTGSLLHKYVFDYYSSTDRLKLKTIQQIGKDGTLVPPHEFTYDPEQLPDIDSKSIDHWGYYNGALNDHLLPEYWHPYNGSFIVFEGSDREPNFEYAKASILTKVKYPTGGSSELDYELNTYSFIAQDTVFNQQQFDLDPRDTIASATSILGSNTWVESEAGPFYVNSDQTLVNIGVFGRSWVTFGGPSFLPKAYLKDDAGNIISTWQLDAMDPNATIPSTQNINSEVFLDEGNYYISCKARTYPNAGGTDKITIQAEWVNVDSLAPITQKKGPGLRIKEIRNYPADGLAETTNVRRFEYDLPGFSGWSSGAIYAEPTYVYPGVFLQLDGTHLMECNFIQLVGSSHIMIGATSGSPLGYEHVKVLQGANGENGWINYEYSTPHHFSDLVNTEKPFAPPKSNSFKTGLLQTESIYDKSGGLKQKTDFEYEYKTIDVPFAKISFGRISPSYSPPALAQIYATYPIEDKFATWFQAYRMGHTKVKKRTVWIDNVTTTTDYTYDSDLHRLLTEQMQNSDAKVHLKELFYAEDLGVSDLVSRNMTAIPLKVLRKVDGNLVSGAEVEYKSFSGQTGPNILPWKYKEILSDNSELINYTLDYHLDGNLETSIKRGYAPETFTWVNDLVDTKTFLNFNWDYDFYQSSRLFKSITDIKGIKTRFQYDDLQRLKYSDTRNQGLYSTYEYNYTMFGDNSKPNYTKVYTSEDNVTRHKYMDGLGRPLQTLSLKYGPGMEDVVHGAVTYDEFGRTVQEFQPHGGSSTYNPPGGPHDRLKYEDSPLSREIKRTFADGSNMRTRYESNTQSGDAVIDYQNGARNVYPDGELYKVTVFDEKGHPTITFTDKIGRVILIRKRWDGNNVDTYYHYDDRNNLLTVIPPGSNGLVDPEVNYKYSYDIRNRMENKKLPGAGLQVLGYNDRDEVVSMTDGNGNIVGYEYDGHGRDTTTLLQTPYANQAVPIIHRKYDGGGGGSMGEMISEQKSVLNGTGNNSITTSYSYDLYGRIKMMFNGSYKGGADNFSYSYEGATDRVSILRRHYGGFAWNETSRYDHVGREVLQIHKMTSGSIYENKRVYNRLSTYNLKDELTGKSLDGLQSISYSYDLRGRLIQINKLPLVWDPESEPPQPCGGSGGGGGPEPNDSTACGGITVGLTTLLDLIVSNEDLNIDCQGDGCDEEDPIEICDFGLTATAVESVCAIYNAEGVIVHYFSNPISSDDPNMATLLQTEITTFLDTFGYSYDNVSVSYIGEELSIDITGTTFNFGGLDACGENNFPFIGDCQTITSFPTGTPEQVAQQQASMQNLASSMAGMTVNDVQYPTTLYKLNLYEGEVAFVLEQEKDSIDGEYGFDDCVQIQNENDNIVFRQEGNTYQKTFAQVLQLRQTDVLDGAVFDGDTGNCETEIPKCYLTEIYPAKAVVATSVIFDSIGTPTIPGYVDLSTQNFNKRDFSLEEDNLYWDVGSIYVQQGEVGWDVGYNTGGSNITVSSFQIRIKGVTEIQASQPPGYFLVGLHNGEHFVKIDEGDGFFRNFITNGAIGEITITVADPELITPYRLNNLQVALYMSSANFSIDAVEVEIEYESSCELCNGQSIPCGRSERDQQQNDITALQNAMQNTSASQLSYPLILHHVQFCDGTTLYVLDNELSQISGSYGILQDISVNSSSQIIKVYTQDGQPNDLPFSDFIELRKTDNNLLVQGPGCPVNIDYEQGVSCFYRLYQDQWSYTNIPNSNLVLVDYEEIVNKQCGSGPVEEVFRGPASVEVEVVKTYEVNAEYLKVGEGYLDSLRLYTKNPSGILDINLNPASVLTTYPGLAATLNPNDLYYNGDYKVLLESVKTVINHAIEKWKQENGISLALLRLSIDGGAGGGLGRLAIGFSIYHEPTDAYIAFDPANSFLTYSKNNALPKVLSLPVLIPGSESIVTHNGDVPCATVSANYSDAIIDVANIGFDQLPLNTPNPSRIGGDDCDYRTIATPVSSCDQPQRIWNGTAFEECDYCTPDPPICSEADMIAQQSYVDSIHAIYQTADTSALSFPDSLHQVMLCDGTLVYIFGQHLDGIPGGTTTVQSTPVGGSNQTFEVTPPSDTLDLFGMKISYEPNGNVKKLRWQVKYEPEQQYTFTYDDLDRMEQADYTGQDWLSNASYQEGVTYKDARGNIKTLVRGGFNNNCSQEIIDDLEYFYNDDDHGNKVIRIIDHSFNSKGFKQRPGGGSEHYRYDANANMVFDWHKSIDSIEYNYLNLPGSIILGGSPLEYVYDAVGKKHRSPGPRDYVNNLEYEDGLEAIYTDEGRVVPILDTIQDQIDSFQYEFVIRDHLGNGRVYFSDLDKNLGISVYGVPEVLQERHYYPFGMMFEGPFLPQVGPKDQYTFNGIRYHQEGELNWYMAAYRSYDPAVGRWWQFDPKYSDHITPFAGMDNNPIIFSDMLGDTVKFAGNNEEKGYNRYKDRISKQVEKYDKKTDELRNSGKKSKKRRAKRRTENRADNIYVQIQKELNDLESSEDVFRIRFDENISNPAGGGNISFNSSTEEIDINISTRSDFSTIQNMSHELLHAYQFLQQELDLDTRDGSGGILYDQADERAAFIRQNQFYHSGPGGGRFVQDVRSYVASRYGHLPSQSLTFRGQTPTQRNDYIRVTQMAKIKGVFPRLIVGGWRKF